jgi:serine-type D-Ala-D-Ala carboxypeptidase/endopeptidase (penicillin-binding protein 4)
LRVHSKMHFKRARRLSKSGVGATVLCLAGLVLGIAAWRAWPPTWAAALGSETAPPLPAAAASAPSGVVADVPTTVRDAQLERQIERAIDSAKARARERAKGKLQAQDVRVAVHVRDVSCAGELVALESDRSMRPASNLKLVTSAAALVLLGADWKFETVFTSAGPVVGGQLGGDLVVHAAGDPLYQSESGGDVRALLEPVVRELRALGIQAVEGDLVLDEGSFAPPAPGPAWPAANQHWTEFCALAGGFSANAGCLTALVTPGAVGQAARVVVRPEHHGLPLELDVRTGAKRSTLDVRVGVQGGVVRVEGSIPAGIPTWKARFAAPDPVELFGNALRGALADGGIQLRGEVRRARLRPAVEARVLGRLWTPLVDMLVPINTHSNNACADQVFFALGRAVEGQGTRAGGGAAVARALERLGVPCAGFVQVDGSGLSRDDRVSARQISALLQAVSKLEPRTFQAFFESLASPAEDGTLDRRLSTLAGHVRAKTGFIAGTSALSGFLETRAGRSLAFSILVEYPALDGLNTSCWKPMQDEICQALFELGDG